MKCFFIGKDGGQESKVWGYWLFESKLFGSVVLLRFKEGSREVFHNHAFNAISWVLWGQLKELMLNGETFHYTPSIIPILTPRSRMHRVFGMAEDTWVLSFRGPWEKVWNEYFPDKDKLIKLTNGRKEI
mgnify:CR=1 FL=1